MTLVITVKVAGASVELKEIGDNELEQLLTEVLGIERPPPDKRPYRPDACTGTQNNEPIENVYAAARADSRIKPLTDQTILKFVTLHLPRDGAPRTAYTAIERLRRVARGVESGRSLSEALELGGNYHNLSDEIE